MALKVYREAKNNNDLENRIKINFGACDAFELAHRAFIQYGCCVPHEFGTNNTKQCAQHRGK